jgi:hypothetical protein
MANWMLLDDAVKRVKKLGRKGSHKLQELREKKSLSRRWDSYDILEELRKIGNPPSFRALFKFGTSAFAIAEISQVVLDKYVSSSLYEKAIPPAWWGTSRKEEPLTKEDRKELISLLNHLLETFFNPQHRIMYEWNTARFTTSSELVASYELSTSDAFLVSQASTIECDYFLTEDKPLRHLLPEYGDWITMKMISAQEMLSKLKRSQIQRTRKKSVPDGEG